MNMLKTQIINLGVCFGSQCEAESIKSVES